MSRAPDGVSKLTESTYKNVMEQFNPGLRSLVTLGKNYEKSVTAMTLAGKVYFEAVSKIGENAMVSPVSRELGVVLMEIAETHRKLHNELDESFKSFHSDIIIELEKKTEMDVKYMNATFKRYQSEHKLKQDTLDRSQTDLKKLRRKSQGKSSSKYTIRENEYMETISSRQTDMQKFIADGCREALLEEKRRFCFLADKHCMFSYQLSNFHGMAREMLSTKLPTWQEKCSDITKVPETVETLIEGLTPTPVQSPLVEHNNRNNVDSMGPPPAPPLKAQISPLANMFNPDPRSSRTSLDHNSDQGSLGEDSMHRSVSQSSGLNVGRKNRVRTIFPHTSGNNDTLLSFDEGDILTLLVHEEKDGWLYGELEKTRQRGWFPSSYCRPYTETVLSNSNLSTPVRSLSVSSLQEEEEDMVLIPPPDYSDDPPCSPLVYSTPSPQNKVSLVNGTAKAAFLGGANPFATVKLRPTVTNDRSAPHI